MNIGQTIGIVSLVSLGMIGCQRGPATAPTKDVPAGIVRFEFVNKKGAIGKMWGRTVNGPVDLTIDGVRIPVAQEAKGGSALEIKGLPVGKHRYFINSSQDAFGPDQGEFETTAAKGVFILLFNQRFQSTLYGQVDSLPKAEGMPGVTARLLP